MKKKILFLTTLNLATNPRLVKEIKIALNNDFDVQVICFEFSNWSKALHEKIKKELKAATIISIPAGRSPFFTWFGSVCKEKFFRFSGRIISLPIPALSQAVSRRSSLLVKYLKKVSKPDWVIGHNPGALYPTLVAAKKFNCKAGFDVEDYHPGEGNDANLQDLTRKLMVTLLPGMDYVSFASPFIKQQVEEDSDYLPNKGFTLLNYFPANEFTKPVNEITGPVRMVWFSQNVNAGRGLELVLPFVKAAGIALELHLIGHLNKDFYNEYLKGIANIIIHPPMAQLDLHRSLAQFDIGLALDIPVDKNRELALTNKILAYLQAGLFVLATNTPAQEKLLEEFRGHGICFDAGASGIQDVFERVVEQVGVIRSNRLARYEAFAGNNWEAASLELLKRWEGDN